MTRLSSKHNIRICQLNVEGRSSAKREILAKFVKDHNIDVLALQETHVQENYSNRLLIAGIELIDYVGHGKFGIATYIKPSNQINTYRRYIYIHKHK